MAEPKKYTLQDGSTKWKFRLYLGVNPKTGKQEYTNRQGFNTKREAKIEMNRIKVQVDEGIYFEKKKLDNKIRYFYEVYEEWLNTDYIPSVAESTLLVTKKVFENRILPAIGEYKIDKITDEDIQQLANDWGEHQSCKKWINFIKRIYKYAQRKHYTNNDPTKYIIIPEPQKPKDKKLFYETAELKQFIKALEDYDNLQAETFLRLLFFTGLRRGEALALKWKFVFFKEKMIQIEHSTERVEDVKTRKSYMRIGPPKNKASYRTISLDDKTLSLLKELHKYKISGCVFNSEDGGLLSDAKPRKWLRSVAKNAGLEPIKVHASRHTHASLLFEAGATIKDVQNRLGHEKTETTMNIYTHVTQKSTEKLGQRFADYVDF